MPKDNARSELVKRIVEKAIQEWRGRPRPRQRSSYAVAHRIGHGLFEDMPKGAWKAQNSKEKNA